MPTLARATTRQPDSTFTLHLAVLITSTTRPGVAQVLFVHWIGT
jgi:hypothetical protein